MGLTNHQAISRLANVTTAKELRELIRELDTSGISGTTLLWSGTAGEYDVNLQNKIYAQELSESLQKHHKGFRTLSTTEAGKFLDLSADSPNFNQQLYDKINLIFENDQQQIQDFLYGKVDPNTKNGFLLVSGMISRRSSSAKQKVM